ncbi:MAG: sigma-70 family RNA polymerase sigma factor [Patescibacteria group bacterium]|nr:sigma-70 family RNA polymerase sigma factor [Patescibacteria group bacterium]
MSLLSPDISSTTRSWTREQVGAACVRYRPWLLKHAWRHVRSAEDAEDLATDAVIDALRLYRHYDPDRGSIATWLYWRLRGAASARRLKLSCEARGGSIPHVSLSTIDRAGESYAWEVPTPPTQSHEADWQDVRARLQTLSQRDRMVLLRRAAGEALGEIAQDLGVTKQRVQQLETAARCRLRVLMRRPRVRLAA